NSTARSAPQPWPCTSGNQRAQSRRRGLEAHRRKFHNTNRDISYPPELVKQMVRNMNAENLPKVGIIFLGRRRPGFDMDWGKQMEERVRSVLSKNRFSIFEPSEKAIDDPSMRRVLAECAAQNADALVLLQTTMGDGRLAPTLAQLSPAPLILWATPEKPDGDMISSCSLVGAHCWASVLRQMGRAFELVYGEPEAAETQQRFREAVAMAVTVRGLRSVRIGMVGGHAPGYFAMGADPFTVHQGLGAQLQTFSLIEFANVANELSAEAIA